MIDDNKEQSVIRFIRTYGVASGGNWAQMLMSAIQNGMPSVYEKLDDNKAYTYDELYIIISKNLP